MKWTPLAALASIAAAVALSAPAGAGIVPRPTRRATAQGRNRAEEHQLRR